MTSLPTRAQANVELPAFDARHNSFCRQITVQIQPVGVPSDNHRQGKPERVVLDDFDFVPRESGINLSRAEFISTTAGLVECCIEPLDTSRRSVAIRRSIQCFDPAEKQTVLLDHPMDAFVIRLAHATDYRFIRALLDSKRLPAQDVSVERIAHFHVAALGEACLAGCVAFEQVGSDVRRSSCSAVMQQCRKI